MNTRTIDPNTDLLPDEQALLDGETIDTGTTAADDDAGTDDAGLDAEALAAIAAKGEQPAAVTDEERPAAVTAPQAQAYNVADPAKFDETRTTLLTKRAEAMKELMDGTLEQDAFAAVDAEVMSGLERLTINRTLHEANVQAEQARQVAAIDAIKADGAAKGVDYNADPALMALFDAKLSTVAAREDMAGKSAAEIYQATHTEVLKLFGKTPSAAPAPAPTPTAAPAAAATPAAPAPKPQIPPTLGALPSAATPTIGNGLLETLGAMENPDDAEAMLAKLPSGQVDAALRATIPNNNRRH